MLAYLNNGCGNSYTFRVSNYIFRFYISVVVSTSISRVLPIRVSWESRLLGDGSLRWVTKLADSLFHLGLSDIGSRLGMVSYVSIQVIVELVRGLIVR